VNDRSAIDAVIIGAGIAGASVAYFMSNYARVVVLERESHPGVHSTGRSAALFSETYGGEQIRALTRASRPFFERPPRGFADNALLSPRGALVTGTREQSAELQGAWQAMSCVHAAVAVARPAPGPRPGAGAPA
jgi:D-arginine dehydrogenase